MLPVYGNNFTHWWRTRFVPEMQRNFDYIEGMLDRKAELSLADLAVLLEDAIDMHDRHWKIHWMLNFAQLSATLNLRAVMEKTHGKVDEVLLGRLQNSADDRNWDKIRALWEMKEEVKGDAERPAPSTAPTAAEIVPALQATERGRRFIDERVVPYQKEFGWHAVWSHEFIFPSFREDMNPVIQLVRDQVASDYDYPAAVAKLKADIEAASREILEGLQGEALEEMRAANEINLKMAPLTPDHHFYIDQGANAHVRLVLIALGEKLVELGVLDRPDDVIMFRYNDAARVHRRPHRHDGRAIVAAARASDAEAEQYQPKDWVGTVTATQLAFPYLNLWGFPDKFYRSAAEGARQGHRHRRLARRRRGHRPRGGLGGRVRQPPGGRDPRLPDDQPGLAGALRQDHRRRHRRRRHRLASGRAGPRVRHPGRRRHLGRARGASRPAIASASTATPAWSRSWARQRAAPPTTVAHDAAITRSVLSEQVKGRLLEAILDGRYPPGRSHRGDTRGPGVRHQPGARARGAPRPGGARRRGGHRLPRRSRPPPQRRGAARGLRGPRHPRDAGRLAGARVGHRRATWRTLDDLVDQMREAAEAGDPYAEATADAAFHGHVMRLSGNATLERVWRTLEPFLRTYITIASAGVDRRAIADRHAPLVEALRSGDPRTRPGAPSSTTSTRLPQSLARVWSDPDPGEPAGRRRGPSGSAPAWLGSLSRTHVAREETMDRELRLSEEFSAGAARLRVDVHGGEPREHVLDDLDFLDYRLADVRISPQVTLPDAGHRLGPGRREGRHATTGAS